MSSSSSNRNRHPSSSSSSSIRSCFVRQATAEWGTYRRKALSTALLYTLVGIPWPAHRRRCHLMFLLCKSVQIYFRYKRHYCAKPYSFGDFGAEAFWPAEVSCSKQHPGQLGRPSGRPNDLCLWQLLCVSGRGIGPTETGTTLP